MGGGVDEDRKFTGWVAINQKGAVGAIGRLIYHSVFSAR